jgi:hypothetical protein
MDEKEKRRAAYLKSMGSVVDDANKKELDKSLLATYKELCPALGEQFKNIKTLWYDSQAPEEEIRELYAGSVLAQIRMYDAKLEKVKDLFDPELVKTKLWGFFISKLSEVPKPIVVFKIKYNGLWVLTNYNTLAAKGLPVIRVAIGSTNNDVHICPLASFAQQLQK